MSAAAPVAADVPNKETAACNPPTWLSLLPHAPESQP